MLRYRFQYRIWNVYENPLGVTTPLYDRLPALFMYVYVPGMTVYKYIYLHALS